jgi:hypothetical protein
MKFTSVSSRLLLSLFIAAPTVAISTLNGVNAQSIFQPISKPSFQLSQVRRRAPGVDKVIARAKSDPVFYKELISNPERALANVNDLDPATKSALAKEISQEASSGRISQDRDICICTHCCITRTDKFDNNTINPAPLRLNPALPGRIVQPQNPLR